MRDVRPEYKDTVRDTRKALLSAAIFSLIVYTILPIGLVGGVGARDRSRPTTTSAR
jgi:hypothetical protein